MFRVSYSSTRLFLAELLLNWSVANNNSSEENTWQQIFFSGKGSTNRIQVPGVGGTMQFPNKSRRGRGGSVPRNLASVPSPASNRLVVAPLSAWSRTVVVRSNSSRYRAVDNCLDKPLFPYFEWQLTNISLGSYESNMQGYKRQSLYK